MKKIFSLTSDSHQSVMLAVLSGVLLGFAYPPFPLGVLAYVGFIPLFFLLERPATIMRTVGWLYLTYAIFCTISLYWVGGFTHLKDPYLMMAGGLLLFWQPVYFAFVTLVFVFVRKQFGTKSGVMAFPFLWVTAEWLYALTELSFPWLTLGNTQTYYLHTIQCIELTGVYGLSFWILVLNVVAYFIITEIFANGFSKIAGRRVALFAAIFLLPNMYPFVMRQIGTVPALGRSLTIGIVQPNIDPWDKWEGASTFAGRWKQTLHYLDVVGRQKKDSIDIAILPETAIMLDLPANNEYASIVQTTLDGLNIGLVSGYIGMHIYSAGKAPRTSSVFQGTSVHYDAFNAVLYVQPRSECNKSNNTVHPVPSAERIQTNNTVIPVPSAERIQTYNKVRLVPFAERIPYADAVPSLIDPLRWGVGISNWGLGKDSTVFRDVRYNAKFLAMICYESIFPEYVSTYVKRGAEFLIFITNDSWWGNTSGARQHNRYAVLRAVENRRWVARCANGGISCFIDPDGAMYDATEMYTETSIHHRIETRTDLTFYARHGDWLARLCAVVCVLWIIAAVVLFFGKKRAKARMQ